MARLGRLRRGWLRIIRQKDRPHSIAGGVALGTFIGMTPTMGIQIALAFFAASIVRVNRVAAIAMVFITNPFTAIPIYLFEYQLGVKVIDWFVATPPERPETLRQQLQGLSDLGWRAFLDVWPVLGRAFGPMALGGVILGILLGAPAYWATLRMAEGIARRRERRRQSRAGGGTPPAAGGGAG